MPPPVPPDIYAHDVDFTSLALQYPHFAKKLKPNRQLDFTDPESVRQLTFSLLHRDFNLTLSLPHDRLCPPVPNRFNYILFIQRLLDTTSPSFRDTYDPKREVVGIDIGTGASAIYPLLGCRQHPRWKFLCTEIDDWSRQYAAENISRNGLDDRIKLISTDPTSAQLIPASALAPFPRIDFVMSNPPFYSSEQEMTLSAKSKSRPANSSCTGAPIEMIYPCSSTTTTTTTSFSSHPSPPAPQEGGEVAFVSQLINESNQPPLRDRIQWFTSMLGKLSSLPHLIPHLQSHHCTNYAVTEFIQGQKTRRWCLAWSWQTIRPPPDLARGVPALEKKLLPFPTQAIFEFDGSAAEIGTVVDETLDALEDEDEEEEEKGGEGRMQWQWRPALLVGIGLAKADCWSRKARRKRKLDRDMKDAGADGEESEEDREPALVFKVGVKHDARTAEGGGKVAVTVRWLQGSDSVLFESFRGWLKRKIDER